MIVETYILLLNTVILVDLFSNFVRICIWKLCVCVSLPLSASIAILLENEIVCVPKPWKVIQMWMSKQHHYNHSKNLIYVTETTNAQEMVPSIQVEHVSACSSFNNGIAIPLSYCCESIHQLFKPGACGLWPSAPGFLKLLWSACQYACVCTCVRP